MINSTAISSTSAEPVAQVGEATETDSKSSDLAEAKSTPAPNPAPQIEDIHEETKAEATTKTQTTSIDMKQPNDQKHDDSPESHEKVLATQPERKLSNSSAHLERGPTSSRLGRPTVLSTPKPSTKTNTSTETLRSHSPTDILVKEENIPAKNVQIESPVHIVQENHPESQVDGREVAEITDSLEDEVKDTPTLSTSRASTPQPDSQEPQADIVQVENQYEQHEPLELIQFNDDLSQYNGDKLWFCMLDRCWSYFQGGNQGKAHMSLQRLRTGKSDANTEFKILCELAENNKDFCKQIQKQLGILENYQGESLLKAPVNYGKTRPDPAATAKLRSKTKPQDQCLTCIQRGRDCVGSEKIGSQCFNCSEDKSNGRTTSEADVCYGVDEAFGVSTYSEAVDFFAYNNENFDARKRKADDEDISTEPTKRTKKTASNQVASSAAKGKTKYQRKTLECFKTALGPFPVYLRDSRRLDHKLGQLTANVERRLIDVQDVQLTNNLNSRTGVNPNDFKSFRAALEWIAWDYISNKNKIKMYGPNRPSYTFKVRMRMQGKDVLFSEEDFLVYYRQLAADRELTTNAAELARKFVCVKPGFLFIVEARPAPGTP